MASTMNRLRGHVRGALTLGFLLVGLASWLGTRDAESERFTSLAQVPLAEAMVREHNAVAVDRVWDVTEMTAEQRAAAYAGVQERLFAATQAQVRRYWAAGTGLILAAACWLVGGLRLIHGPRRTQARQPTAYAVPPPPDTTMMMSLPT